MIATCTHCGEDWELKSVNPNRTHPRYCSSRPCQRARANALGKMRRERNPKPVKPCKNCGNPVQRNDAVYCDKRECYNAYKRERYARLGTERKMDAGKWNVFAEAVDKQPYNVWVNGRSIHCETCRFNSHCTERVRFGIWVACETPNKRDMELLAINPHRAEIDSLLVDGMSL